MKQSLRYLIFALMLWPGLLAAQDYQGFCNSNYAGVNGVFLQPASIVDSRYKVDINLIGFDFNMQNNYVGLLWKKLKDNYDSNLDFQKNYLYENVNKDNKYIYMHLMVQAPSISFNINKKNSLAVFARLRSNTNADDISPELAKLAWEGLKYPELWKQNLQNQNLSIQTMVWAEYGFTYGREIINTKNGKHYLKAAASFKVEQGLGSAYLYAKDLNYNFTNNDTLSIYNSAFNYGHSTNFDFASVDSTFQYKFVSNFTIGFDMGVVYEWRPDIDKHKYDMDGETGILRRDQGKYKLKVGFSLLDIGNLKFTKGDISGDFTANMINHNIHNFKPQSVKDFNDSIANLYTFSQTSGQTYRMNLPTAISFQVDYNIWRGFYANFTGYISFKQKNDVNKLHDQSTFSITPRYEHRWFDIGVPVSYNTNKQFQVGGYVRLGILVLGTNNFLAFTGDKIYGANVYAAIKIPIPYGKPRDRDHDGVSNRKDHCKKIPGTWETHGCPDTDGDGIADDKDKCPTVKGPKENDGCPYPDRDSDGVADKDDKCPDVKGTVANFGCPEDKDSDGVTDDVDKCPTVAGPKENFGCPYTDRDSDGVLDKDDKCPDVKGPVENLGCPYGDSDGDGVPDNIDKCIHDKGPAENGGCPWPDTDGDGVLDKDDQCPKTPGPVENHGCPVLKEKEKEILKKAFDNLEFVSGQAIIRSSSFASLNTLAELLKEKPDATLLIAGHTDNTGSHEINMKLSKARAEAVKKELMARGVKADQLNIEYYGETKPIADNNTAAGRQKNRRVEMTMSYK